MNTNLTKNSQWTKTINWNKRDTLRHRHCMQQVEEEMSRCQYKNIGNNTKTCMMPSEPMSSPTARPEHTNAEEAEFITKNDFKKVIEALKEEIKNSLKELEEKTNKKIGRKQSQEKAIKQMKETVQNLKIEIETIKKTQTEGRLERENLTKQTGTTDKSITNRMQEMEQRISDAEDTIEKIDSSVKENTKAKKVITQNIQEIWDTMKRPNLRIIGIEEGEEYHLKGIENIFSKIMEENLSNLKKELPMQIQETYRTPNRLPEYNTSSTDTESNN
ncbi:hypothetical protein STEG23_023652 [Scotinomys teguina]